MARPFSLKPQDLITPPRFPQMMEWQMPFGKFRGTWSYEQMGILASKHPDVMQFLQGLLKRPTVNEIVDEYIGARFAIHHSAPRGYYDGPSTFPWMQKRGRWVNKRTGKKVTLKDIPQHYVTKAFETHGGYITPSIKTAVKQALQLGEELKLLEEKADILKNPVKAFPGQYLYHVTPYENLERIRKRGLAPPRHHMDPELLKTKYGAEKRQIYFSTAGPEPQRLPARNYPPGYGGMIGEIETHPAAALTRAVKRAREEREVRDRLFSKVDRSDPAAKAIVKQVLEAKGRSRNVDAGDLRSGLRMAIREAGIPRGSAGGTENIGGLAVLRTPVKDVIHRMDRKTLLDQIKLGSPTLGPYKGELTVAGRIHPKRLEILRAIQRAGQRGVRARWGPLAMFGLLASALAAGALAREREGA